MEKFYFERPSMARKEDIIDYLNESLEKYSDIYEQYIAKDRTR